MMEFINILGKIYIKPTSAHNVVRYVCDEDDISFDFKKFEEEYKKDNIDNDIKI